MLTDRDYAQIASHGLTEQDIKRQLHNFETGFPFLQIVRPAVIGDGIHSFDPETIDKQIDHYTHYRTDKRIVKFVPASGAATRMFKKLFEFLGDNKTNETIDEITHSISEFAFHDSLVRIIGKNDDPHRIISAIVNADGLNYGNLPKALILFHAYPDGARTAAEEHLVEGAMYAVSNNHDVNIHFTVSPEHLSAFEQIVAPAAERFGRLFGVRFNISYSTQKPSTDTIAVTKDNQPFRNEDGTLLFRPAGHGALLANLNEIDAEIVFIKTVDNVAPDRLKGDTVKYKKVLAGLLLDLQQRSFSYLRRLDESVIDSALLTEVTNFIETELGYRFAPDFQTHPAEMRKQKLHELLHRPIRVCGMVRNEGEPGGGPFWVADDDGSQSLQIAESSQIAPDQRTLMKTATHFNPVDLVCGLYDYKGAKFDLQRYTDPRTGFISTKSKNGRELKAQELPGLWNGAMAHWNTVFVEVPITTFSPVKVVNDLLRPAHRA